MEQVNKVMEGFDLLNDQVLKISTGRRSKEYKSLRAALRKKFDALDKMNNSGKKSVRMKKRTYTEDINHCLEQLDSRTMYFDLLEEINALSKIKEDMTAFQEDTNIDRYTGLHKEIVGKLHLLRTMKSQVSKEFQSDYDDPLKTAQYYLDWVNNLWRKSNEGSGGKKLRYLFKHTSVFMYILLPA